MSGAAFAPGGPVSRRPSAARPDGQATAPAASPRRRLGGLAGALAVMAIGLGVGLGATWFATGTGAGFGSVKVGPWVSHPRNGAIDADPYSKAVIARSGEIPLGLGEGLSFAATRDGAGQPLIGSCSYRVVGRVPPTRFWTLTLHGMDGSLIPNAAQRFGFTSGEVVRDGKGVVTVTVSADASPGNWLPVGSRGRFQLALRLYDTPVSGTASAIDAGLMPRIEREACR
jgi:hypothetical protein